MSLINELIQSGYLKSPDIIGAFRKIRREDFLLPADRELAEVNAPFSIGFNQTNSQPLTVAFMLELLQPKAGEKIFDVGSGSGWTCALLAKIVGPKGKVFGLERVKALKNFAEKNVDKYDYIKKGVVQIFYSDGYKGLPDFAPFAKIIVAAAAETFPAKLLEQLAIGGRMVIPVGPAYGSQEIVAINKLAENKFKEERYPGFIFVPLVKDI